MTDSCNFYVYFFVSLLVFIFLFVFIGFLFLFFLFVFLFFQFSFFFFFFSCIWCFCFILLLYHSFPHYPKNLNIFNYFYSKPSRQIKLQVIKTKTAESLNITFIPATSQRLFKIEIKFPRLIFITRCKYLSFLYWL